MKYGRKDRGHNKEENHRQGLTSAEDLTIMLPDGARLSLFHRLDKSN